MADPKLQRWIDLLAALLAHRRPVTFDELAQDVPAYRDTDGSREKKLASIKRTFERDKAELLALGVPIQSVSAEGEEEFRYQLRPKDFYLPYLGIATARGLSKPKRVDKFGYRSLESLAFEPDELEAIAEGGRRIAQAGDPALAEDARNALRKLAFDLPLGASDATPYVVLVPPAPRPDPQVLAVLSDALFRRKRVSFPYHGMGDERGTQRTVEPYGLFFQSGHWYLAARDIAKHALRNFRVSRMPTAAVNKQTPGTPDYAIPAEFSLREHARSRHAWEIGDGDSYEATVEFTGETGAAIAAAALGRPDATSPTHRRFHVRRTDSFARWLLTFAGEAKPISPEALVREYDTIVQDTRALYAPPSAQ